MPVPAPDIPVSSPALYVPLTEAQKFHNFEWNALGPVAFAGSSFAAAINQGANFPHVWGQGADAYGARVASNLGISLVTATAQYSMAEAFHEDTAYYRCACVGFSPRFGTPRFRPLLRVVGVTATPRSRSHLRFRLLSAH